MLAMDIKGMQGVDRGVARMARMLNPEMRDTLDKIGQIGQREARENAPRSPSTTQYRQSLKTERGKKKTKFKGTPGGLENSIEYEVDGSEAVHVQVPSNSHARDYAKRIHKKLAPAGKWKRGVGTVAKGDQAGGNYIKRAVNDNKDKFRKMIEDALQRIAEGAGDA